MARVRDLIPSRAISLFDRNAGRAALLEQQAVANNLPFETPLHLLDQLTVRSTLLNVFLASSLDRE